MPICEATKSDGSPCQAPAIDDSGLCIGHGSHSNGATRRNGGYASSNAARAQKLLPARMKPIFEGLEEAFHGVKAGTIDPRQGSAMASLAGAMIKVLQASEYEERIRSLEAERDRR